MESEIIKLEEELRLAMIASDVTKLDELISESLVFVAPNGYVVGKQDDLGAHRSGIQKISSLNPSEMTVQGYGDFYVVTVKMELVGTYGENSISGAYRYTRVWTKVSDKFQIVAGSVVQIQNEL